MDDIARLGKAILLYALALTLVLAIAGFLMGGCDTNALKLNPNEGSSYCEENPYATAC